jgi:hypothetical protein
MMGKKQLEKEPMSCSRNAESYLKKCWQKRRYSLLFHYLFNMVGQDISVGIVTHYGLDGPGFESRWGRNFPHKSRPPLGTTQPPMHWIPGISHG